ncbi:MAG: hypothetical protein J6V24_07220, partial [Clostridia bacterium]|nr:hypothetical protein [Clostridia bacterium]
PTALVLHTVDASTGNPLAGAGFRVKVKNGDGFATLSFRLQDDGSYFCDPDGSIQEVMTDGTGELRFYGLPLGDIWVEESITPEGYFPISAQKVTLTREHTSVEPFSLTITNYKFVKLGMDSDWWEFPALCLGILLLLGSGVTAVVLVRRRKRGLSA